MKIIGKTSQKSGNCSQHFRPLEVIQKNIIYKLALLDQDPPRCSCSLLNKKIGPTHTPTTELPIVRTKGNTQLEPIAILDRSLTKRNNVPVPRY